VEHDTGEWKISRPDTNGSTDPARRRPDDVSLNQPRPGGRWLRELHDWTPRAILAAVLVVLLMVAALFLILQGVFQLMPE
jgi:hypothetical protein